MKKSLTKLMLSAFLVLGLVVTGFAQKTVTGTVMDGELNEALIGATVQVKGTTIGTVTDFNGVYTIKANEGDILLFSYTGFDSYEQTIGADNTMNVTMTAGQTLDEIVVVGYGSQNEKEITSSVVQVGEEEFNKGVISDPAQLLQGKVSGLQVYNRGGDPNGSATIRLRGISTVGANASPLIVIDGIIGGSLDNVDPNDIESMTVLKDGSAAAIYGTRGSSGVIIVTTKSGKGDGKINITYNGQVSASTAFNSVDVLDGPAFVAAGGTDLGSNVDWTDEVTQTGVRHVHSLAASGSIDNTNFRISGNVRETNGILKNSGFDQFNTRLNLNTRILDDKLKINFTASVTNRNQDFSFNEALRYAVLYNPTAPIFGADAPFEFASENYGGYFETLGLFDSFNPLAVVENNRNTGVRREFNYGATFGYNILDNLTANFRLTQQKQDISTRQYYPTTSLFRGNASNPVRKGLAEFFEQDISFETYETYLTYTTPIGTNNDLTLTGGYSFQETSSSERFLSLGDFPNDLIDYSNSIEASQDLATAGQITANSAASPDERIIAFFGRANMTFDNAIFVNASIRREGSSKLGIDNRWGWFPAVGVGVDLNRYLNKSNLDLFKVRLGYGITGALPGRNGLSQPIRNIVQGENGAVGTNQAFAKNDTLQWEQKAELNFGIEVATGRFGATLDLYTRNITDFILERNVEVSVFGVGTRFENSGELQTRGLELALNYDVVDNSNFKYNTGIVLSTYKTTLEEFPVEISSRGNLGAPGQNGTNMILVEVGEEVGNIIGPVFEGVADDGSPVFQDINNDGQLIVNQDNILDEDADFAILGNGTPDLELGWTNMIQIGDWSVNAFFRGAFGHSLVNTFRAFYEPRVSTQSSYNFVTTDKAVDGLTSARFSSLYVEKADFFKLDNLTISRRFNINSNSIQSIGLSLIFENPIVITGYSGIDPEPSLVDFGPTDNGGRVDLSSPDVLSPGIDRRNNYFSSRAISLGVNVNF